MEFTIKNVLQEDEKILWQGKPSEKRYKCSIYLWTAYLSVMFPFLGMASIQAGFLVFFITTLVLFIVGIFLCVIFLIPNMKKAYGNMLYVLTDKRIISQHGIFAPNYKSVEYHMITDISVRVGFINSKYKTGDIILMSNARMVDKLRGLDNPYEIFNMTKNICEENRKTSK